MGAHNIEMTVEGTKTKAEVMDAFHAQQAEDRDYNGHRGGYSGDFQTVHTVKFYDKVFSDENEAQEFCLDHAKKWVNVIAVKVVNEAQGRNEWFISGWGAC